MNGGGRAGIMSHIKISFNVILILGQVKSKWICHDAYVMCMYTWTLLFETRSWHAKTLFFCNNISVQFLTDHLRDDFN